LTVQTAKKAVAIAWADKAPITVKEKSELVSVSFKVLSIDQSSTTLGITVVDSAESSTAKGTNTVKDGGISFKVDVLLGDVNLNNEVDANDALLIKEHLVGLKTLTDEQKERANVNGISDIDANDALLIKEFLVGIRNSLN